MQFMFAGKWECFWFCSFVLDFPYAFLLRRLGINGALLNSHPPATSSDLTFRHFVDKVIEHNRAKHASFEGDAEKSPTPAIGLKLDFKSPAAVERCISHLLSHKNALSEARVPLWLNADLWKGPGGADSPFSAAAFASQCTRMLREYEATSLSLGWTTGGDDEPYTECHVEEALESLRKLGLLRIAGVCCSPSRFACCSSTRFCFAWLGLTLLQVHLRIRLCPELRHHSQRIYYRCLVSPSWGKQRSKHPAWAELPAE